MDKRKKVIFNVIVSLLTQIITLGLGFLVPRIILLNWGSEYNGFVNSVNNIIYDIIGSRNKYGNRAGIL